MYYANYQIENIIMSTKDNEYPKILYTKGWDDLSEFRIVLNESDEKLATSDGYKSLEDFNKVEKTKK